jgi:AcrR family transcriptional regulator
MAKQLTLPRIERDASTEQRILDAAHTVFIRRGTAGARTQEIADEAGVNKALLHYYFRTKDGLAAAVFKRAAMELFGQLRAVMSSDAELEQKVRQFIAIELDQFTRTPYLPGYILGELNQQPERASQLLEMLSPVHQAMPSLLQKVDAQIKANVRAGTMRPVSVRQFFANLVALCVFPFAARPMLSVVLGLDARGFQRFIDERKQALPDFFLNALRP